MITRLLDGLARRRTRRAGGSGASGAPETSQRIDIVYAPEHDGDPDPGEVVWTWVTFEDDPSQGKDRPVVVIGRWGRDLAAVALTSKDHGPDRVPVGTGAWDPQQRPSFAKIDRLLRVDPAGVRREGSTFDRRRFDDLVVAVRAKHPEVELVDPSPGSRR